jgi:hypothetical protein
MPSNPFDAEDPGYSTFQPVAEGRRRAAVDAQMLRERPSGDLFGWTQNAGMGWDPAALGGKNF